MQSTFIDVVNFDLKPYKQDFIINPLLWKKFVTSAQLTWSKIEFTSNNKRLVPKCRGVYAFVVEYNHSKFPTHGYIMYVGISGDTSNHTLRERYGNYLTEKARVKRPRIHYLLNHWSECLYFHYAEIPDKRIRLNKLEKALNDVLIPPFNTNDFSAEIKDAKRAF
jgi:hypothetical protein